MYKALLALLLAFSSGYTHFQAIGGGEMIPCAFHIGMAGGWKPVENSFALIANPVFVEITDSFDFQRGDELFIDYMCTPYTDWYGRPIRVGQFDLAGSFRFGMDSSWNYIALSVWERDYAPIRYNLTRLFASRRYVMGINGDQVYAGQDPSIQLPEIATATSPLSFMGNCRGRFYRYYHKRNGKFLMDVRPRDIGSGVAAFYDIVSGQYVPYTQSGSGDILYGIE